MFGDRRGPIGNGEKTGKGLGYCSGYDSPGYRNVRGGFRESGFGGPFNCRRGLGIGRGFGSGMGFGGIRGLDSEYPSEKDLFKKRKELLEKELEEIKLKIENLDK